uniref:Uncharacterized protein n=1 Tax=Anguilla anguilla TaxID=7936 RepID=A0A0E9VQK3_ANGAN
MFYAEPLNLNFFSIGPGKYNTNASYASYLALCYQAS